MILFIKIVGIIVISFNLFTIWKIYKADVYQKWWKYLFPVIVNFPTFIATKEFGFDWKLFSLYSFGSNIAFGYEDNISIASLPIGSFYIWWKLRGWEIDKEFDQVGK
jgi:hypothetical protein